MPAVPKDNLGFIVRALRRGYARGDAPVKRMPKRDAFRVLVSCILSTRTQDPVTAAASERLLARAPDAAHLARLKPAAIERLIYPVGFYRTKAKLLPDVGRLLLDRWQCRVPDTLPELVELPGVGRKVANIVLGQGFGIPAIAVDTHVHRISNRLGLVRTKTPEQTEQALARVLPKHHWIEWNQLLVAHGQTCCRPVGPKCGECPVSRWCRRVGVSTSRRRPRARPGPRRAGRPRQRRP